MGETMSHGKMPRLPKWLQRKPAPVRPGDYKWILERRLLELISISQRQRRAYSEEIVEQLIRCLEVCSPAVANDLIEPTKTMVRAALSQAEGKSS
jgi:hypothetical protein